MPVSQAYRNTEYPALRQRVVVRHNANQTFHDMKTKFRFTLVFLIVSFATFGQDTTILKRTSYKLKVAVDKKAVYEEDLNATPYVQPDKTVQLYPGETVYIEVEQENGVV